MIRRIDFKRETRLIEVPICLAVTIIFMILCNLGLGISRIDAIILTVLFILFIAYTIFMAIKGEEFDKEDIEKDEVEQKNRIRKHQL